MKNWSVWIGKDGYGLEVYTVPAWALAMDWLCDAVIVLTFHLPCCRIPNWTYRVPIGKKDLDPYPMEDGSLHNYNSLGSYIYRFGSKLANGVAWRRQENVVKVDLTREQAQALTSDWTVWDDDQDVWPLP